LGSLSDITRLVDGDLEEFRSVFSQLLQSPVRLINIIARHMVRQRGKRIRPLLVILSSRLCGTPTQDTYKTAAIVEMLHNATLIHDDVVDSAGVRRGGPTLNAIWKNKVSVLMGDYILARSLVSAAEMNNLQVIEILSNASARLSQGEINQLVRNRKRHITEEDYMEIIGDKTAALISACCQLGAVSVGAEPDKAARLKDFGEKIGMAFQIRDDLLDIEGDERIFGKRRGTDLRDGKVTLPLIHALKRAPRREQSSIMKRVKKKPSGADIRRVIAFIRDKGGVAYAAERAEGLLEEARAELDIFPDSDYKAAMLTLSDFFVNRKR